MKHRLDRRSERIGDDSAMRQRGRSQTACVEEPGPRELVGDKGSDDGGFAGSNSCARGTSPAVMDDCGHVRKKPVVRSLVDREDGGG